jgi:hypothetical protein
MTLEALARSSLAALLLACAASSAFANGSLFCQGSPYSAEVQFSLSSGRLTDVIVSRDGNDDADNNEAAPASRRIALQRGSADYHRQRMLASGKGVRLRVSKARGTLAYAGKQHTLRCDWSSLG